MEQVSSTLALPVPSHSRYTTLLSDIKRARSKSRDFNEISSGQFKSLRLSLIV